jgi:SAM-dependent methyltransferase
MRAVWLVSFALVLGCETAPSPRPETSVKPGINDDFLAADVDIGQYTERFEGESREIAVHKRTIAGALGLEPGETVADVGSGTGLFLAELAARVGPSGRVLALDISPAFVEHLSARAREEGLAQVEVRLCGERSVDLPAGSVDLAFLCDVYHHFEYPKSSMSSIHAALRDGGEVVLVDFERIPGVSREFILGHVRAGKDVFVSEIESFGFEKIEELELDGLEENYVIRFRKR